MIEEGRLQAVMSTLVLTELLVPLHAAGQKQQAEELKRRLCTFPNLSVMTMTAKIASTAARLRPLHGLRTPDAIHAATALETSAEAIITNDRDFPRLQGGETAHMAVRRVAERLKTFSYFALSHRAMKRGS